MCRQSVAKRCVILFALLAACVLPAVSQQGPSFEELAAQAAAARDQQNLPLAIDLYRRAEDVKPDWTEGWWYLTLLQYSTNRYSGAVDSANHLLQIVPTAVPAMVLRGLSEFELADYTASLSDLETAIAHGAANDPHNEQIVRYHLALLLTRSGRYQEALDQYAVFATRHLSDPEMLVGLGLAGLHQPSLPSEVAPADRATLQQAGAAGYAFLEGDSVAADAQFQHLFAEFPTTPNLHQFYALLLYPHSSRLAAQQFNAELDIAPQNTAVRALLAYTLTIEGRYSEALLEAQRAVAADPDMEMAQVALGRSLGETGQVEQGIALLRTVLEHHPDDLEAHIGMAALLGRAGRREEAYRERMACLALQK